MPTCAGGTCYKGHKVDEGFLSCADWKSWLRPALAEFIAMILFIYTTTESITSMVVASNGIDFSPAAKLTMISFVFGLSITVLAYAVGHLSGAHINPAVTFGVLITRRMPLGKGLLYIVVQLVGGICGSALAYASTGQAGYDAGLARCEFGANVTLGEGFLVEFMVSFFLVFVVFATAVDNQKSQKWDMGGFAPLAIGVCVLLCHYISVYRTGASLNPARALGPAVVTATFVDQVWVHLLAPFIGGGVAALMYQHLFLDTDAEDVTGLYGVDLEQGEGDEAEEIEESGSE